MLDVAPIENSAQYYDWKNSRECGLNDASSCPKSTPGQMNSMELSEMRLMVESEDYRHLSPKYRIKRSPRISFGQKSETGFARVNESIYPNRESDCEQQNRMSIGMLPQRLSNIQKLKGSWRRHSRPNHPERIEGRSISFAGQYARTRRL